MRKPKICGNAPLWLQLSLHFAFFGLLIAYIVFIVLTMGWSHKLISYYHGQIGSLVESTGSIEELLQELQSSGPALRLFQSPLAGLPDPFRPTLSVRLFSFNGLGWEQIGGPPLTSEVPKEKLGQQLDRALEKGISRDHPPFWGRENGFSFAADVSSPTFTDPVVIHFSGIHSGLISVVSFFLQEILFFSLLFLLLSFLLSQLFVKRIIRPIHWLSEEARKVASGARETSLNLHGRDEIARLSQTIDFMKDELSHQISLAQHQADVLETMNRIDKAVLSSANREHLLGNVADIVSSLYPKNGLFLMLVNRKGNGFDLLVERQGINSAQRIERSFASNQDLSSQMRASLENPRLFRSSELEISDRLRREMPAERSWVLNMPIVLEDSYYGSLLVTSDSKETFGDEDIGIIKKLTDQVGVALQNILYAEEREQLLLGSLKALSAAVDAKSSWTAGHSERVRLLSLRIGEELEFGESDLQQLSISALLHDIGKLAISEAILDKPGKLTEDEYEIIKKHPRKGAEICDNIPGFPDVVKGILYHHEHWDGSGYPCGLVGGEIPRIARIICVADVYDAITAKRPYRNEMSPEAAKSFLLLQRGTMFEPQLVDLFINLRDR
jgi:putative nucleotidyltransferase with HDIG domain